RVPGTVHLAEPATRQESDTVGEGLGRVGSNQQGIALSELGQEAIEEGRAYSPTLMRRIHLQAQVKPPRMESPRRVGDLSPGDDQPGRTFRDQSKAQVATRVPDRVSVAHPLDGHR